MPCVRFYRPPATNNALFFSSGPFSTKIPFSERIFTRPSIAAGPSQAPRKSLAGSSALQSRLRYQVNCRRSPQLGCEFRTRGESPAGPLAPLQLAASPRTLSAITITLTLEHRCPGRQFVLAFELTAPPDPRFPQNPSPVNTPGPIKSTHGVPESLISKVVAKGMKRTLLSKHPHANRRYY